MAIAALRIARTGCHPCKFILLWNAKFDGFLPARGQYLKHLLIALIAAVYSARTLREGTQIYFAAVRVFVPGHFPAALFHQGQLERIANPDSTFAAVAAYAGWALLTGAADCDVADLAKACVQSINQAWLAFCNTPVAVFPQVIAEAKVFLIERYGFNHLCTGRPFHQFTATAIQKTKMAAAECEALYIIHAARQGKRATGLYRNQKENLHQQ